MSKASLISVVDDDQFFRESMRRLLRSLGYAVEAYARPPLSSCPLVSSKLLA